MPAFITRVNILPLFLRAFLQLEPCKTPVGASSFIRPSSVSFHAPWHSPIMSAAAHHPRACWCRLGGGGVSDAIDRRILLRAPVMCWKLDLGGELFADELHYYSFPIISY